MEQGSLSLEAIQVAPSRRFPVDTRHFPDTFKWQILSQLDDLDANTDGILFNSENFQALNLMQEKYSEQVKCIYIDPPYNTGNDGFLYKDAYQHSTWLSMIADRLLLATPMLQKTGLFFASIDDIEFQDLRGLCDEWLGEASFVGTLTWIATTQPDNIGRARFGLQQNNEFILLYSKCPRIQLPPFRLGQSEKVKTYPHQGKFGPCRFEIIERAAEGAYNRDTLKFPILNQRPRTGKQWQFGEETAKILEATGKVEIVDGIVKRAVYPEDEEDDKGLVPFWAHLIGVGSSQVGKAELTNLLGRGHDFDTVKPLALLTKLINYVANEGYFLDYFAGSGTTGHAIININRTAELESREDRHKYLLCEAGKHFDTVLIRRLKKAVFASQWNDSKPVTQDTVSHTIKYHTLEQYEDTLNNLEVKQQAQAGQQAADLFGDEYLLRYMLDFETRGSASLLNLSALTEPFSYTLNIKQGDEIKPHTVDLVETFNYLLGLSVKKMRRYEDNGREYRAVFGTKDNQRIVIVWRDAKDLAETADALAGDKAFISQTIVPDLLGESIAPDRLFVNSPCAVAGVEAIEPEFKRLMFGEAL